MLAFLYIIGGLVLLVAGGEALVKGAVAFARNLGISAVVIGLTVVAFSTSAPELFISIEAAAAHPDIAIGNVLGSNIANILLVVGATAIIVPVATHRRLAKRDGTVMMAATLLLCFMFYDGMVSRVDGLLLLAGVVAYTLYTIRDARQGNDPDLVENMQEETDVHMPTPKALAFSIGGMVLLAVGSDVLVEGAVMLARTFGLAEAVIGATIVAVGTSTPELVTSLVAAFRRHGDIGLANVVGSNIFNIMAVLGGATLAATLPVAPHFLSIDVPLMAGVTALFFVAMLALKQFGRAAGVLMLCSYLAYIGLQYNLISA